MTSNVRPSRQYNPARNQRGVGLVEVLIAVLIMGIGMLGVAAMQATALRNSQSSLERSQAVVQTYAILDAMRANRAIAITSGYNMGMTCAPPPMGTSLAATDRLAWINDMQQPTVLGTGACGQIECVAPGGAGDGNHCTVTVQWDESRATADGSNAAASETYSIATQALL
ncbi:MAG: type IV pilus modification protein PilV [Luteimonas sp.]